MTGQPRERDPAINDHKICISPFICGCESSGHQLTNLNSNVLVHQILYVRLGSGC